MEAVKIIMIFESANFYYQLLTVTTKINTNINPICKTLLKVSISS